MIETRKFCDCCRDRIETPYVVIIEGYYQEDKKVEHYCIDCARVLREAWRDAVKERREFFGVEQEED